MNKKYQVFISSTYKDLKIARQKVVDTILAMGHFPVGMEMFGARDEEQWKIIEKTIDQSDYYIVIIGKCFGTQVPGDNISYTQKEFRYAKEKGIPILAFIIQDDATVAKTHEDTEPEKIVRLNAFKREIETGRTVDYWENPDNLATKVAVSLPNAITSHPMPGWVRMESLSEDGKVREEVGHIIEIKQTLEKELIDYSWVKTNEDRISIARKPWKKFPFNNMILRDASISNPSYNNGLIKVEPYDFYDDGFLVGSSRGGGTVTVRVKTVEGKTIEAGKDVYIVDAIPFSRIIKLDRDGSKNNPYPTLYCFFKDGNPFDGEWYIDKNTGIRYTDEQIIFKDWEAVYLPTPIVSSERSKLSLFACVMALFAAESNDGRIIVLPSLSGTSYIAGGRSLERNQTPRELARWDDAVSQLLGRGYIKLVGKNDQIYSLTADGFNLIDLFKEQYDVDPSQSSAEILARFGVPNM